MKVRVFSGIQPTGNLHIGNYLGALKNWVEIQSSYESIFCIVDLHAITLYQKPEELSAKIREIAGLFLAAGIDPKHSSIIVQSSVSGHAELPLDRRQGGAILAREFAPLLGKPGNAGLLDVIGRRLHELGLAWRRAGGAAGQIEVRQCEIGLEGAAQGIDRGGQFQASVHRWEARP